MQENSTECMLGAGINKKNPIAHEVLYLADRVADRAENLINMITVKVIPVMRHLHPTNEVEKSQSSEETYPPLFEELRSQFRRIDNALNSLEDAYQRIEL